MGKQRQSGFWVGGRRNLITFTGVSSIFKRLGFVVGTDYLNDLQTNMRNAGGYMQRIYEMRLILIQDRINIQPHPQQVLVQAPVAIPLRHFEWWGAEI